MSDQDQQHHYDQCQTPATWQSFRKFVNPSFKSRRTALRCSQDKNREGIGPYVPVSPYQVCWSSRLSRAPLTLLPLLLLPVLLPPSLLRCELRPWPLVAAIDLILARTALHLTRGDQGDVPVPDADLGHHHHYHHDLIIIIIILPSHWVSGIAGAAVAPSSLLCYNLTAAGDNLLALSASSHF